MNTVKELGARRIEILDASENLFITKGYTKTTIADVYRKVGISRGTLYHYFKTKEDMMEAVVKRIVDTGNIEAKIIAANPNYTVHEKIFYIITANKPNESNNREKMAQELHKVENVYMHQKSLTFTIQYLSPILSKVVQEGIDKGIFHTPYPSETMELLLTASEFMFDEELFQWDLNERATRVQAFTHLMEVTLGAETGSFAYMVKLFETNMNQEVENIEVGIKVQ